MEGKENGSGFVRLIEQLGRDDKLLEGLLSSVPASVVIVDKNGRIVFVNGEVEQMFGYYKEELLGEYVEVLLPERYRTVHPVLRKNFFKNPTRREMGAERNLWALRKDGSEFPVEVGLGYVCSNEEIYVSAVLVNISRRKAVEEERKLLINELEEALKKVKQLRGMLPICASCKKIRDDNGYWNQLEVYIRDHSEAEFSHSLCPECVKTLYPDLF
jgi:PAS domain S-box-containing protein